MTAKAVQKRTTKAVARKTTARKAPARTLATVKGKRNPVPLVAFGVFVVVVIISVTVGYSDDGQIDVTNTFNERVNNATPEEREELQNIPVQQRRPSAPNGGLVPTRDPNLGDAPVATETPVSVTTDETSVDAESDSETQTEDETPEEVDDSAGGIETE